MDCLAEGSPRTPSTPHRDECDVILVVDNDPESSAQVCRYLTGVGFRTLRAASGREMWEKFDERVALVLLEHLLPGDDGLGLCRSLRYQHQTPVIMTSAQGSSAERVIGLEIGADDYLCKPFDFRELLARIRAVRRRVQPVASIAADTPDTVRCFADWRLDLQLRRLYSPKGEVYNLTRSDFFVLEALSETPNRIISRDELSRHALGREYYLNDRSVDVCISRLRHCLEDNARQPRFIRTVRNEGYLLEIAC